MQKKRKRRMGRSGTHDSSAIINVALASGARFSFLVFF
jgi:hypothetical protein